MKLKIKIAQRINASHTTTKDFRRLFDHSNVPNAVGEKRFILTRSITIFDLAVEVANIKKS